MALVDFDTARDLRAQRTHGASLAGTFGYVPIEQLGGTVDATSDLYALGATLIHLLSRKAPHELLTADLHLDFSREVNLSPGFTYWLQRLVAREPGARFQSVQEAQAALTRSERANIGHPERPAIEHTPIARAADSAADEDASAPVATTRVRAVPPGNAYLAGRALGRGARRLYSFPEAVAAIAFVAALVLSSPRSATGPVQSGITPVVARPDIKPLPTTPREQPNASWHWLKLPQEVWNARFGRVTLRGGNYTLMGDAPRFRISVSIDPSVDPAFDIRKLGAHLLLANGQTVEATKLRLDRYNLGPDSAASLLELSFRLQPGVTLPIHLVIGDNTPIPLDLTLEVQ